ncbi:MAG: DUF3016 domain-containing protein [Opitutaceae bacterium]|jgi:hypothetical protein
MKPQRFFTLFIVTMGLLAAGSLLASESSKSQSAKKADSRIEVIFQNPEKFTDVKDSGMNTDSGRDAILSDLKSFLEKRAEAALPQGDKLQVTFTDIDLAGEYEPWRINAMDVRIVKDIYPPRFEFTYKITDAKTGAVVKEGKETLQNLLFMQRMVIDRNDPLRYEKDMLGGWISDVLKAPAK